MIGCKIAITDGWKCHKCCFFCDDKETCEDVCTEIDEHEHCEEQVEEEETDLQVMNSAVPEAIEIITSITVQMEEMKKQQELMKTKLLEAMERFGVKKFENEKVSFTYVAPTTRSTIDSAKLKKDHPELAEQYTKTSAVKASVRISVK